MLQLLRRPSSVINEVRDPVCHGGLNNQLTARMEICTRCFARTAVNLELHVGMQSPQTYRRYTAALTFRNSEP
jgi:hypothetical protein